MEQQNAIESLFHNAAGYIDTNIELLKLKAVDKSSDAFAAIIYKLVVFILLFSVLIFAGVGLALWLGDLLGKTYYGFFIVAGVCIVACILFYIFRNEWLKKPFSNTFIKEVLN